MNRKDNGESPKRKCADDPIPKCPLLQCLGEGVCQDGEDNGVVSTEDPFKEDERKDYEDVVIVDGRTPIKRLEDASSRELPKPSVAGSRPELNPLCPPSL
jgi:hypothetical protein